MGLLDYFKKTEQKANPPRVVFADESTRGAINKVLLPNFLFKPPFGTPRYKDVITLRRLGKTAQIAMAKQLIIDEVVSIDWSIKPKDSDKEQSDVLSSKIEEVEAFFENPNTNNQSFEYLLRQMLNDLLDMDSGIWVKEFDKHDRMVEIVCADGASFLKNPDIHGRYGSREDIITDSIGMTINPQTGQQNFEGQGMTLIEARDQSAYFQFGFITTSRPIPFGRREIVWFEKNPQTEQLYGRAPVENIQEIVQSLLYSAEYNLDYFEDNNIPRGFINLAGSDAGEMEAFRDRWNEMQMKVNQSGLLKKSFHRVPITNTENASFVNVQFSSQELQLLESQQWFSKLAWAMFGVTPSELGFTENSNKATESGQNKINKRKSILPLLRTIEYFINNNIISEWDFGGELKFEFNTYDIEDEFRKYELYEKMINTKLRTRNELRREEGLEEIEGGDTFESDNMANAFQKFGDPKLGQNEQEDQEGMKKEAEKEKEQKALMTSSPIAPKENEVMGTFKRLLREKEKEILAALKLEAKKDRLTQIKSLSSVIDKVKSFLNLDSLRPYINAITKSLYESGMKSVEKTTKQDVNPNEEQIKFLSNNTFSNIKGMESDIENKLKQQLRMGIMNGEGIGKISERVKSVFDVADNRADAIARTETARAENFGSLEAAKKANMDMKKYISIVSDARTSEVSKAMFRKYGSKQKSIGINETFSVKMKGKEYSGLVPPFMPNDRDQAIFFLDDGLQTKSMKDRLKEAL